MTELDGEDVIVVAMGSEINEDPDAVLAHKQDNDFKGTFAVATEEMIVALQDEFGPDIIVPPTSPVVLLGADQTEARLLPRGVKDADALRAELEAGP